MNYRTLPEAEIEKVRETVARGNVPICPVCKHTMAGYANQNGPKRPEAYCEPCHLSIPLWT